MVPEPHFTNNSCEFHVIVPVSLFFSSANFYPGFQIEGGLIPHFEIVRNVQIVMEIDDAGA